MIRHKKTTGFLALTAFLVVALSGCVSDDAEAQSSSLYVKDALTDRVAEVHVTFSEVQVLPAGQSDWITVYRGARTVDLLALSAPDAREKLSDLDLAAGAYAGLRIAASEATIIYHNGTSEGLVVAGNVISLAESFEVPKEGGQQILVDFDLERSVDVDGQLYAATVKEFRTSGRDTDGDGVSDFDDLDDPGVPEPAQSRHNGFGVCTAWTNTATAREQNATLENSSAFQNLSKMAGESNQTIEAYCAAQEFPGPPDAVPEEARAYYEAAMERREAARDGAGGAPEDPSDGRRGDGNQTQQGGNQSQSGGNQSRPDETPGSTGQPDETPGGGQPTGRPDE